MKRFDLGCAERAANAAGGPGSACNERSFPRVARMPSLQEYGHVSPVSSHRDRTRVKGVGSKCCYRKDIHSASCLSSTTLQITNCLRYEWPTT